MKKILIAIIVIILIIFAYGEYKEYKRFHPNNANIEASKAIDLNYHDKTTVYNYFEALSSVNNYMQMQWSANEIDVKSPEDDDEETQLAVKNYGDKLAKLKHYETVLKQSKSLKAQGFTNADVKLFEEKNTNLEAYTKAEKELKKKALLMSMMPEKNLYSGEKSVFVFEMQKLLVKKGYDIPVDGVYKNITSEALKDFEEKNNMFPDGKIDIMSLKLLMQ